LCLANFEVTREPEPRSVVVRWFLAGPPPEDRSSSGGLRGGERAEHMFVVSSAGQTLAPLGLRSLSRRVEA